MSDFKIIGNPDPVVGKEEFYSVNTFLPSVLPFQNSASSNSFEQPVKWEIYILENGRWRKTKENDKTGKRISYTFLQKSLERKGIRILARRGEDVARLNVTTHPAEKPKIESIELLDKNGQKPGKPLSYGQTLKARVHCLHMEKHKVSVTLWEDDAIGAGHNKANENNLIQTLSGVVANGKADVDFLLRPSFAKIAKQNGPEEGKIHEYYVTVDFNKDKIASNNVNVNDLEAPVAPFKGKVPVQQQAPAKPKASLPQPTQPKTKAPATGSSSAPKVKAEITRVHITNSAKQPIKGTHKEKEIIVWVDSQGLIGKEIRFKLYDEDCLSNDLLVDQKFKITGDIFSITVHLDRILRSKGGISGEGAEQELFADVEVIQTSIHSKSEVVDVDAKVFKPDPVEQTNKTAKIGEGDKSDGKEKEGGCENCIKDITLDQIKKICVDKKGKCLIEDDAMITSALPHLNAYRKKVGINTCVRKAHFLAQIAQESKFFDLEEGFNYYWESLIATFGAFTSAEGKKNAKLWGREIKDKGTKGYKAVSQENQINIANWAYKDNNSNKGFTSGDGYRYRGRGFKQITWKSNYKTLSEYFNKNMKINNEADVNWETNYSDLMNKPKDAMTSALAYWGKNNINSVASENSAKAVEKVTKKINSALKGLEERKSFFKNAVDFLKVNDCKKGSDTSVENGTVVIVSGTDTKKEKDPAQDIYWVMYKTSVYRDMSLQNYKKLKASKKLPNPDYTTYLSRDTHQTYSKKQGNFKHSDKRFGQYNEIPPGEYFLVPGVSGQTYKIYVIDSESKGASAENGIDGVDGARGGVALHQYCPRFSVGCFTFNSGTDTAPVTNFIKEIPDLKLKDDKPVRFIVEERKVVESTWDDPKKGTKKWTGI